MKKVILFLAVCLLCSCNGKTLFSETDSDFQDNRWLKSDIKTYEFEISQAATPYEAEVFLSYVYGYQFSKIPLIAEITYPDGQITSAVFDFATKDDKGADLGDCSGDYCDLTQRIPNADLSAPGKYKVRLMHNFNGEFLPNILALGLRVKQLPD